MKASLLIAAGGGLIFFFRTGVPASSAGADHARPLALEITLESRAPYYQPYMAVVTAGTPIRWVNPTASPHAVMHEGCLTQGFCAFKSDALFSDGSFTLSALPPGVYRYQCELHPIMRGILIVESPVVPTSDGQ